MTDARSAIFGKNAPPVAKTPGVALINPKYPHNVGAALRACSCFGVKQLWFTGDRVELAVGKRLPREERMKGYKDVDLYQYDYLFDQYRKGDVPVTPVAIEVRQNSEQLPEFEHPENPLYVFGPEDGSIPSGYLRHCHRFVIIPTLHCTNLAAAVYLVLYDRYVKRRAAGLEPMLPSSAILNEQRGPVGPDGIADLLGYEEER